MHLFIDEVQAVVKPRISSLIDVTAEAIAQEGLHKVGLLASPTTFKSNLFQKRLANVSVITLSRVCQEELEKAIRNVIGGQNDRKDEQTLLKHIKLLEDQGAEKVILGCTELSVLADGMNLENTIDPLALITKRLLR